MPSPKPSVVVPDPNRAPLREIQLVNRVEEVSALREAVDRAAQGGGGIVFLGGEAGIGKTRLARELVAYAALRGMQVLHGRCPRLFKMDGSPPYALWTEVMRNYLQMCTSVQLFKVIGDYPGEVCKLLPEIKRKLGPVAQSLPISPECERNRLFEAVSQFITNISRETPLLIVLDDLQWTDESSLLLLHYIASGIRKYSLLLLGGYRDTDIDETNPLFQVLTELNRERLLQSVPLKRMSLKEISEMIAKILEQEDVPREFCELVYEKTRGNPFFVEEVIKSLKEEETIYREDNKYKIKEVSNIQFPTTVKSVVKTRISRLDDECQKVLAMASFIGKDFALETLREVVGIERDKLLEQVERILKTGLFRHKVVRGQDVCSFSDIVVRDVVYEEVGPFRRRKLHGIVGHILEKVYAESIDEHFGELATHFLESGDKDKALEFFLKGGEKAANIYANGEAAYCFQSAFNLLAEKDGELEKKERALERLGDIKRTMGEYDVCVKYWNDTLQLLGHPNEKEKASRLHRKIANVLWDKIGDSEKAREHHTTALKILETMPESVELASLYEDIAHMHYRTGDMVKALSWAEKAIELAEKLNACDVVASSCVSLGTVLIYAGNPKKAIESLEKGLRLALDHGYVESALRAYNNIALKLTGEENEKCLECYEKGLELAKKVGDIYNQSMLGFNLAGMYFNMGNLSKGVLLANEAVALDRKTGNIFHLYASTNALGFAYQILGELDKSEQCLKEALSVSQRLDDFQVISGGYSYIGLCHFYKGDYVKAKEFFEKLNDTLDKAGDKFSQMNTSPDLIHTYLELGEIEKANNLIDSLHKFALKTENKDLSASADRLRAMLFRAQKKWSESLELFEKSLQEFEALKARQWNPYLFAKMILCEYARVYLERDQEGDRQKAHNLLNQALEMFQKMGAKKDIEKTVTLIEVLHPPPTLIHEKTVGLESYEYTEVQGNIILTPKELRVGESLELEIELTNTRKKGTVLLTKIMEVVPEGFAIVKKSDLYRLEGNCLNMKKKRLGPLKTEEVKLVLTPKIKGTFHIKPKILYLDENGKEKTHEPKPISITVKELGIKGWLKGER